MAIAEELRVVINAEVEKAIRDLGGFGREMDKQESKAQRFANSLNTIGRNMQRYLTLPILGAAAASVKFAADIERQQTAFGVLLQDVERGNRLFEELKTFSAQTPLQLEDITAASQTLLAFGTESENVIEQIGRIGDVAQGNAEKLNRITLAFGKIQARGKASMEEINILIEAGVPIIATLAENFGVAESQIFDFVSSGRVGFEEINEALVSLTSDGGQFEGMMERISQTTAGKFSTAIDNAKLALAEFGAELLPIVNEMLEQAIEISQAFAALDDETKKVILTAAAATAVMGPLAVGIVKVGTALKTLATPPAGYIVLAIGALTTLATVITTAVRRHKEYENAVYNTAEALEQLNEQEQIELRTKFAREREEQVAILNRALSQRAEATRELRRVEEELAQGSDDLGQAEQILQLNQQALRETIEFTTAEVDRAADRIDALNQAVGEVDDSLSGDLIPDVVRSGEALDDLGDEIDETGKVAEEAARKIDEYVVAINKARGEAEVTSLDLTGFAEALALEYELYEGAQEWVSELRKVEAIFAKLPEDIERTTEAMEKITKETKDVADEGKKAAIEIETEFQRIAKSIQLELASSIASGIGKGLSDGEIDVRGITRSVVSIVTEALGQASGVPGLGGVAAAGFDLFAGIYDRLFGPTEEELAKASADARDFIEGLDIAYQDELTLRQRYLRELEEEFDLEFDILRDAWERNLIGTDEFVAGMRDLNDALGQRTDEAEDQAELEAATQNEDALRDAISATEDEIRRLQAELRSLGFVERLFTDEDEILQQTISELQTALANLVAQYENAVIDLGEAGGSVPETPLPAPITTTPGVLTGAKGLNFMTRGPQLLLVGDNASGREHVQVTPSGQMSNEGLTVNFYAPVYGMDDFGERIEEALQVAKERGRIA
jgi:tape measure domain-containing protein